jgi:hypothetical protein
VSHGRQDAPAEGHRGAAATSGVDALCGVRGCTAGGLHVLAQGSDARGCAAGEGLDWALRESGVRGWNEASATTPSVSDAHSPSVIPAVFRSTSTKSRSIRAAPPLSQISRRLKTERRDRIPIDSQGTAGDRQSSARKTPCAHRRAPARTGRLATPPGARGAALSRQCPRKSQNRRRSAGSVL